MFVKLQILLADAHLPLQKSSLIIFTKEKKNYNKIKKTINIKFLICKKSVIDFQCNFKGRKFLEMNFICYFPCLLNCCHPSCASIWKKEACTCWTWLCRMRCWHTTPSVRHKAATYFVLYHLQYQRYDHTAVRTAHVMNAMSNAL